MTAVKFTFDDDFDGHGSSMSQRKLEDMRREAYDAGRAEALAGLEQNCEVMLRNLASAAQTLTTRHHEQITLMNKETAKLAYSIIEKLAPATAANTPLSEIELLVENCLKNSPLEPRLVIRVDDGLLPLLQDKIKDLQKNSEYPGQIVLIAEQMTHVSDCRVEWANGGVERDFDALMKTIGETVQMFIDAPETVNNGDKNRAGSDINPQEGTFSQTVTT